MKKILIEIKTSDLLISDIFAKLRSDIEENAGKGDEVLVEKFIKKYNELADYMQSREYCEPIPRLKLKSHPLAVISGSARYVVEYNEKFCAFCGRERSVAILDILSILPNHPFRVPVCDTCSNKRYLECQKKQESAYALIWGNAANIFRLLPETYKEEANKFLLSLLATEHKKTHLNSYAAKMKTKVFKTFQILLLYFHKYF